MHLAVDTLGNLLALHVTPANEQGREQVSILAKEVQEVTRGNVQLAYVDQGYTGDQPEADAADEGVELNVVRLSKAKLGFVLLPRRWAVERSLAWATRFWRISKEYGRLPSTVVRLQIVAFVRLMLKNLIQPYHQSA